MVKVKENHAEKTCTVRVVTSVFPFFDTLKVLFNMMMYSLLRSSTGQEISVIV